MAKTKKEKCNELGALGELKAQLYFAQLGFEIYTGTVGNLYYDFIAVKVRNEKTPKVCSVEVKSSTTRNKANTGWVFNIRKSFGDIAFDNTKVDYLCLYIGPLDRVVVVKASDVTQKREYLIKDKDLI